MVVNGTFGACKSTRYDDKSTSGRIVRYGEIYRGVRVPDKNRKSGSTEDETNNWVLVTERPYSSDELESPFWLFIKDKRDRYGGEQMLQPTNKTSEHQGGWMKPEDYTVSPETR